MADQLDLVFKKIVSRQYSSAVKEWYEENPGVPFKLKGSDVWVDTIPETPPANDTAVIKVYTKLALRKDTSVPAEKAWVAEDPINTRIGSFIGPRYGQDYTVRVFDGANKEIPTTDGCGWFWDYESGVLTFDNDPGSRGWNDSSFKVDVYQYIGSNCDDIWSSLKSSAWQEPTLTIASEPPGEPNVGDRYLISKTPTPGSDWESIAENIAEWDGVIWHYLAPKSGMITYVIDADKLYLYDDDVNGWGYSGIDAVDLDYDVSNSDLDSITVKEAIDEIDRLIRTPGHSLYVDVSRVDTYIETGSIVKPYKTLAAAVAVSVAGDTLRLQPGTYNGDGLTTPDEVSVVGESMSSVTIIGNIAFGLTGIAESVIKDITFYDTTSLVTFNNKISGSRIKMNNRAIINNDFTASEFEILSQATSGDILTVNDGVVKLSRSVLNSSTEDLVVIRQLDGEIDLAQTNIIGTSSTPLVISSGGVFKAGNVEIKNAGTGLAATVVNDATLTNPNVLIDVRHRGGISTEDRITVVEGVVGGNPTSTIIGNLNLIYRGTTQLKNDSLIIKDVTEGTLIGLTAFDAIDRVAEVVRYDKSIGELFIEPCVDDTL